MIRSSSRRGFTLIEMLTVMLIIAVLAGIVMSINGLAQSKAARARAEGEMKTISLAAESFKADNGIYPRNEDTDALDPRDTAVLASSPAYQKAGKYLYIALSGDTNANGKFDADEGKSYAGEFFKPNVLGGTKDSTGKIMVVNYIKDPYDNAYGYSTAAAAAEENFIEALRKNPQATRPTNSPGYNSTFDLWTTAGSVSSKATPEKWVKNW